MKHETDDVRLIIHDITEDTHNKETINKKKFLFFWRDNFQSKLFWCIFGFGRILEMVWLDGVILPRVWIFNFRDNLSTTSKLEISAEIWHRLKFIFWYLLHLYCNSVNQMVIFLSKGYCSWNLSFQQQFNFPV